MWKHSFWTNKYWEDGKMFYIAESQGPEGIILYKDGSGEYVVPYSIGGSSAVRWAIFLRDIKMSGCKDDQSQMPREEQMCIASEIVRAIAESEKRVVEIIDEP